ncbi:MAG: replication-relaxation family protein [Deltaproteobacteria bacterium]|nr:replication-relaxation family protein [Deltaproteobacteria bacterium]
MPRDLDLLYTVGRFRLATTSQLRLLFFGSAHTARDRIAKLREAGFLKTLVRGLADEALHALTPRGRTLLVEEREIDPGDIALSRSIPSHAAHFIRTNDVRAALVVGLRQQPGLSLVSFTPEWALGDAEMRKRVELVPDALVVIDTPAGEITLAVEVDLGTEPPNYVARRKLATYDRLIASGTGVFGVIPGRVAVLAPGLRRLRHLAGAIREAGTGAVARLGDLDDPEARSLLAPSFAPATALAELKGGELAASLTHPLHPALVIPPYGLPLPQGEAARRNTAGIQGSPTRPCAE